MGDENTEVPAEVAESVTENPEPVEQPTEPQPEAPPAEATVLTEESPPEETKHEEIPSEETKETKPEESPQEESKQEEGPPEAEESSPENKELEAEAPPTTEEESKDAVAEKRESKIDQPAEAPSVTETEKRPSALRTTESIEKKSQVSIKESRASLDKTTSFLDKKSSVALKSSRFSIESMEKKTRSVDKQMDSRVSSRDVRRTSRIGSRAQKVLGSTIDIRRMNKTVYIQPYARPSPNFINVLKCIVHSKLDLHNFLVAIPSLNYYHKMSSPPVSTETARYMNTYKLDSDKPFNPDKVKKILESVMLEAFENLTYDPEKCPKQAKWATSAIRARVKELQFDRYKIVCVVTIGEKTSQDVLVTCRFLWDVDRDRYAFYFTENTYVFGIAMCFGVYYE